MTYKELSDSGRAYINRDLRDLEWKKYYWFNCELDNYSVSSEGFYERTNISKYILLPKLIETYLNRLVKRKEL